MSTGPTDVTTGCVLGQKYQWFLPVVDRSCITQVMCRYGVCEPIARVLVCRNLRTQEQLDPYLFPETSDRLFDPELLTGAVAAVERIEYALAHDQQILIAGDYDVDGLTSTALVLATLRQLGARINYFLPHRVRDGYGLSKRTVERAHASGYQLIITVDNGICAYEAGDAARQLGVDLIITDHHRAHEKLPHACAVVDPNRLDCQYPFKHLAGVGVAFKLMQLLVARRGLSLSDKMYELLALGTIADVVPLIGENRIFVRRGLLLLNELNSLSVQVLKANGKLEKPIISSQDVAFVLAPQLNALGRLQDPRMGVQFLLGDHRDEAERIGQTLHALNESRKTLERSVYDQVEAAISAQHIDLAHEHIIMAAHQGWEPGVVGLVASRLVSAYGRPALLFHVDGQGYASGSCRSIAQFNIFQALANVSHLFERFGGHAMAAGVKLRVDNLSILKEHLENAMRAQFGLRPPVLTLAVDASVRLCDINDAFVCGLDLLEPFGNSNECPVFNFTRVTLVEPPRLLKDVHVKCKIFADGVTHQIIFFNRPDVFQTLMMNTQAPFDLVAHVGQNYWQGTTSIELRGLDIATMQR